MKLRRAEEEGALVSLALAQQVAEGGTADAPSLEEDVAELLADLHERVQRTAERRRTLGLEVVLLERRLLPLAAAGRRSERVSKARERVGNCRERQAHELRSSTVRSVSSFWIVVAQLAPFSTE